MKAKGVYQSQAAKRLLQSRQKTVIGSTATAPAVAPGVTKRPARVMRGAPVRAGY